MFERRLKILLGVLGVATTVLFARAFSVQVVHGSHYAQAEHKLSTRPPELLATTRGRILDVRGEPLAVDTACTDACVDYRACVDPPDPRWVEQVARDRLKARFGPDWRRQFPLAKRTAMLDDAEHGVVADVDAMWAKLAQYNHPADPDQLAAVAADPRAAIDEVRRSIVRRVEMRRRLLWTAAYRRSRDRSAHAGGIMAWLGLAATPAPAESGGDAGADAGGDQPAVGDAAGGPDIDAFQITLGEQKAPHVVLHAVDPDGAAYLGKRADLYPGLSLRPSVHRSYPLRDVACHVLGRVGGPSAEELRRTEGDDPRTRYEPADAVGREGVEALCEPLLRGVRGRVDRTPAGDAVVGREDFVPGQDVRLTIDARLQATAQDLLRHVVERGKVGSDPHALLTPEGGVSMHAAIVVIDVPTGEVRAMASNPGFDVNDLETRYAALAGDEVEAPLVNRATGDAVEPGSTVKPMLGLAAVTAGTVGPTEGIECTGSLYLPEVAPDGRRRLVKMPKGRCWVVSEYGAELRAVGLPSDHHRVPSSFPHKGIFGNPDGWLTLSDALERSCDIYFETVADRLGPGEVCRWYDRFGLGRPTGVGVREVGGLLESQVRRPVVDPRMNNCYAGMGQGTTLATPLQIANAAATIARGGWWVRPRLVPADVRKALDAVRPRPDADDDVVNLQLKPEALAQAKVGMTNVVTGGGGTGKLDGLPAWLTVAAKTGTADTSAFTYKAKTPNGGTVLQTLKPVVRGGPETDTPWYRSETGHGVVHAWYMGYAPVDHPQLAFAVLVEYAGIGGGPAAGPVAAGLLDACVADGYLRPPGGPTTAAATQP